MFPQHFSFSQTFTSVSITQKKHEEHVFYFFQKIPLRKKENKLVYFDHQNVNSLCSRHHYINSSRQFCVSIELYKHGLRPISMHICFGFFLVNMYIESCNLSQYLAKVITGQAITFCFRVISWQLFKILRLSTSWLIGIFDSEIGIIHIDANLRRSEI